MEDKLLASPSPFVKPSSPVKPMRQTPKPVSPVKPQPRLTRSDIPSRKPAGSIHSRDSSRDSYIKPAKRSRMESSVSSSVQERKRKCCPFQKCGAELSKSHVLHQHLPSIFHPAISGEDITFRRIGALKLVSRWLLGQRSTLDNLICYVDSTGHVQQSEEPEPELKKSMEDLCKALGVDLPSDLTVYRSRNPVTALLHWKVLAVLLSLLETHQIENLHSMFHLDEEEKAALPSLPQGFDSHCHLDRTIKDLRLKTSTLDAVVNAVSAPETFEIQLTKVVGVFCDPSTYPSSEKVESWTEQGVLPVISLHPRQSITEGEFGRLQTLLSHPKVAGLGEVGLDCTESVKTWAEQMLRLQRVLTLLKPEHVLVIHARSDTHVADEAC